MATWAPLLVAGGGLTVAFITGFARRDQRVVSLETSLDARTNTAIRALTEALNRSEEERERIQKERDICLDKITMEHRRAEMAEGRANAAEDQVAQLEAQIARMRRSTQTYPSPPDESSEAT